MPLNYNTVDRVGRFGNLCFSIGIFLYHGFQFSFSVFNLVFLLSKETVHFLV